MLIIKNFMNYRTLLNQGSHRSQSDPQTEGDIDTLSEVTPPRMYAVLLLNDDYTPMDFVVLVLKRFFGRSEEEATHIMLDVHKKGSGVAGVFSLEIAEMKVMQVNQFAQLNKHPLKSTLQEAPL